MEWMLLPFKRYADFNGRSRRMEYWMFALFNLIVMVVLGGIGFVGVGGMETLMAAETGATPQIGALGYLGFGLLGIYALATIIPNIAVVVRRLHDRDMSGWWYLGFIALSFIPVVGFLASIAMLVIFCLKGTDGDNRFGPDPLRPGARADIFA